MEEHQVHGVISCTIVSHTSDSLVWFTQARGSNEVLLVVDIGHREHETVLENFAASIATIPVGAQWSELDDFAPTIPARHFQLGGWSKSSECSLACQTAYRQGQRQGQRERPIQNTRPQRHRQRKREGRGHGRCQSWEAGQAMVERPPGEYPKMSDTES